MKTLLSWLGALWLLIGVAALLLSAFLFYDAFATNGGLLRLNEGLTLGPTSSLIVATLALLVGAALRRLGRRDHPRRVY